MDMMRRAFLLSFAALLGGGVAPGASAGPPEVLIYGSVAGMEVSIVSKSGLDTPRAAIKIGLTRENAGAFCRRGLNLDSPACIEEVLHTHGGQLTSVVRANCEEGTWTDMFGLTFQFLGRNDIEGEQRPAGVDYLILDRQTVSDGYLTGTPVSAYQLELGIFRALCPGSLDVKDVRLSGSGGVVDVNRPAKGDFEVVQPQPVPPRPKPKPIEVMMMAAVNMRIMPVPGPSSESRTGSGSSLYDTADGRDRALRDTPQSAPVVDSVTASPSGDVPFSPQMLVLDGDEELLPAGEAPGKDASRIEGERAVASRGAARPWGDAPVIGREGKGSLLTPAPQAGSGAEPIIEPAPPLPLPIGASSASSKAGDPSLEQRIAALESKLAGVPQRPSSDRVVCKTALSQDGTRWETSPEFREALDEAQARKLTIERCRKELGLTSPADAPPGK